MHNWVLKRCNICSHKKRRCNICCFSLKYQLAINLLGQNCQLPKKLIL